ncbi:MAG: hypothetical protein HPY45_09925 [Anaerolineae bacterium]|nr:hypothetical protein [Anaerolineae bacterium]
MSILVRERVWNKLLYWQTAYGILDETSRIADDRGVAPLDYARLCRRAAMYRHELDKVLQRLETDGEIAVVGDKLLLLSGLSDEEKLALVEQERNAPPSHTRERILEKLLYWQAAHVILNQAAQLADDRGVAPLDYDTLGCCSPLYSPIVGEVLQRLEADGEVAIIGDKLLLLSGLSDEEKLALLEQEGMAA